MAHDCDRDWNADDVAGFLTHFESLVGGLDADLPKDAPETQIAELCLFALLVLLELMTSHPEKTAVAIEKLRPVMKDIERRLHEGCTVH